MTTDETTTFDLPTWRPLPGTAYKRPTAEPPARNGTAPVGANHAEQSQEEMREERPHAGTPPTPEAGESSPPTGAAGRPPIRTAETPPIRRDPNRSTNPGAARQVGSPPDRPPPEEDRPPRPGTDRPTTQARPQGGAPPGPTPEDPPHPGPISGSTHIGEQGDNPSLLGAEADSDDGNSFVKGGGEESDPAGFIQAEFATSRPQHNYIEQLLKGQSEPSGHFYKHVLVSTLVQPALKGGWVPCYCRLIEHGIPGSTRRTSDVWKPLRDAGLLEVKDFAAGRASRRFRIPLVQVERFLEHAPGKDDKLIARDLFTGKRCRKRRAARTLVSGKSRNGHPPLIRDVLSYWKSARCLVNRPSVEGYLADLKKRRDAADSAAAAHGKDSPEYHFYQKLRRRYIADKAVWDAVRRQGLRPAEDMPEGIFEFVPAYALQEISGRLSGFGSLQNASREMKKAAYSGIPGLHNYDIESSQMYILLECFEEAEIDTRWLREYVGQHKSWYAGKVGITVDLWKTCLYALLFHGTLHPSLGAARRAAAFATGRNDTELSDLPAIAQAIARAEEDGTIADAHAAYERLCELLSPLYEQLQVWHDYLIGPYWEQHKKNGRGWFAENACGIRFRKSDWEEGHELKSKMAAWILQGKESAFIHHLTLLSEEYDYEVIANEHDGLVVIGTIPDAAIQEARERSGFSSAQLVEKPFVSASAAAPLPIETGRTKRDDRPPVPGAAETPKGREADDADRR